MPLADHDRVAFYMLEVDEVRLARSTCNSGASGAQPDFGAPPASTHPPVNSIHSCSVSMVTPYSFAFSALAPASWPTTT